jgi:hypothetical protein
VNVAGWPNTAGDADDETLVAVLALPATCTSFDVLPAKDASSPYTAEIASDPRLDKDAVYVAFPELSTSLEASVVAPSMNATVPVGVPAPGPATDTDAVKVTDSPYTAGCELKPVTVVASFTCWVSPLAALVANEGSPL